MYARAVEAVERGHAIVVTQLYESKEEQKKNKKEEYIFSSIVINVKNNKQKQRTIINYNRKTLKVGSVGMVVEK